MSPSALALHTVVGHVARRQGVVVDDDDLAVRVSAAIGDAEAINADVVVAACAAMSLKAEVMRLSATRLRDEVSRLGPVILLRDGRPVGIAHGVEGVIVRRVMLRRLSPMGAGVAEPTSLAHLRTLCGADAEDVIDVVVTQPATPIDLGHHGAHPFTRARQLLRLEARDVGVVAIYGAFVALLSLATPLAVNALVSSIAFSNLLQPLVVLSVLLAAALVASGFLRAFQLSVVEMLQRRLFVRLVADLAWRLPRISGDERRRRDPNKLVNRFFDVVTAQKVLPTLLIDGTTLALELVIGLTLLGLYSPLLLAFAIMLLLAITGVIFGLGRGGVSSSIDESYAKHDVAGFLEEMVRAPSSFRSPSARRFGARRVEDGARAYLDARRRHFRVLLRQAVGAFALQAVAAVSLLGVGGVLVIDGVLTLGQLVAAELIVGAVTQGLIKLHKQIEAAYDLFAALDKLGALVGLKVEDDDSAQDAEHTSLPSGPLAVVVDDAVVADADAPISFSCPAGGTVAVGGGASAIVDVLLGAEAHSAGRVRVGGIDVGVVARDALRERIAVARDVELFEGSLAENIRVGRTAPSTSELIEALRLVELDEQLLGHGDGLKAQIVPGSPAISDSVARRLMIARAFLGKPGVLIVDSLLDTLERGVRERIVSRLQATKMSLLLISEQTTPAAATKKNRSDA